MTDDYTYCVFPGCHLKATSSRPVGMSAEGDLIEEPVCGRHLFALTTDVSLKRKGRKP